MTQFQTFGLPAALNDALARMNYTVATPVQTQAIPPALQGRDVLGSAQTGTGKTAAFCIPLVNHLMKNEKAVALVMTPTRELATQVTTVAQQLAGRENNIRTALLIGGDSMVKQFKQLNNRPRLIIGTPGRINDHLRRNRGMLEFCDFLVLDEADRMLDMGFTVQIDEVLKFLPKQRQTLMFSATMPHKIAEFSKRYMNNPVRVAVAQQQASADNITHEIIRTNADGKYPELVKEIVARDGSIIIFVKTKRGADKMARRLQADSYDAEAIHGDLKQSRRDRVIADFRNKKHRILVATDVASRGLDVPHVEHVINYDLPQVAEDYIHRIGRTARAGAKGNALCILLPSDGSMWSEINRLMNPGAPGERHEQRPERNGQKPRRSGEWRKQRNRRGPDSEGFRKEGFRRNDEGRKQGGYNAGKPARRDGEGFRPEKRQESGQQERPYNNRPRRDNEGFKPARQEGGQEQRPRHGEAFKPARRPDAGQSQGQEHRPRRDNEGFKPARKQEAGQENRRERTYNDRDGNRPNRSEGFKPQEGRRPYQGYKKDNGASNGGGNRPQSQHPQQRDDQGFRPPRRQDARPQENRQDHSQKRHDGNRGHQPGGFKKGHGKPFRHKRRDNKPGQSFQGRDRAA